MDIHAIITDCRYLLKRTESELRYDNRFMAIANLAKLRELLNAQPELEAGGACESD